MPRTYCAGGECPFESVERKARGARARSGHEGSELQTAAGRRRYNVAFRLYARLKLVLYFYPKADTPGCTKEAIEFSRLKGAFAKADADILGVSADSVPVQDKFKAKHRLSVALASDETHRMLEAYGVWREKTMYGRKFLGIVRTTVLIGPDQRILRVWPKVSVTGHADDVLAAARSSESRCASRKIKPDFRPGETPQKAAPASPVFLKINHTGPQNAFSVEVSTSEKSMRVDSVAAAVERPPCRVCPRAAGSCTSAGITIALCRATNPVQAGGLAGLR